MNSRLVCLAAVMPCTTRSSHRARRTARACHSDSTQSHAARRAPATTAALDRVGQAPESPSSIDAKHGRVLRRIHVQIDDVCGLLFKPWIVGGHVAVQPMLLQPRLRPHPLHGRLAEPQRIRHLPARPMRGTIGRLLLRLARDAGLHHRSSHAWLTTFVTRVQTRHPLFFKTLLPARYRECGRLRALHDLAVTSAIGQGFPELPTSQTRKAPSCNCSF